MFQLAATMFLDQEKDSVQCYSSHGLSSISVRTELPLSCLQDLIDDFSTNHCEWDEWVEQPWLFQNPNDDMMRYQLFFLGPKSQQ